MAERLQGINHMTCSLEVSSLGMGSHGRRRNDALLWWMMRDGNQTAEQEYEHIQLLISSEYKRVLCGEAA